MPSDTHAEQAAPRPGDRTPKRHDAEAVRGGRIVLDTPRRRTIFIAGLVGAVVLALLVGTIF